MTLFTIKEKTLTEPGRCETVDYRINARVCVRHATGDYANRKTGTCKLKSIVNRGDLEIQNK